MSEQSDAGDALWGVYRSLWMGYPQSDRDMNHSSLDIGHWA
ncbi:hypothetical protein [Metabacillus sp. FJAT-52054]|uniref:Uncharacterized protein n=1 Tax=Metabacillus sediminis TaxID=3117746 RepID=A0ABZ2NK02_9BACI